ncbi:ParB/RepB/Spo0J family partition protein [Streptomyces xantholiticus]
MSSKASRLGTGASFAHTQPVSARRQAINAATKAPTDGAPPPLKLSVELISLNPANPRSELGDLTQLAGSLRDHGQKQAISIMSRFSYVEANPDMEGELEEGTKYVAIDGNSRLAAAREAGLTEIKVTLDEELGSNRDEVLESALVANIHRRDLDPLDEARALQQLLNVHKSQEALAARLHRSQGWVSQRLALLGLTPELKERLLSGQEPAELLRRVGNKRPEEQEQHLQRLKEQRQRKAAPAPVAEPTVLAPPDIGSASMTAAEPSSHYGVMEQGASPDETPAPVFAPSASSTGSAAVPDPRPELPPKAQIKMPWDNGDRAMDIAFEKLTTHNQWHAAFARYLELVGGPEGVAQDLTASSSPEFRAQLIKVLARTD